MKRYALWKKIAVYSIVVFIASLLIFVVFYNQYSAKTLQEREQYRYRKNCETRVADINKLFLNVRIFAYNAIYAEDSMMCLEQALTHPEEYQLPSAESLSIGTLIKAQDYAQNIMLFTKDDTMYLKAGIAEDNEIIVNNFLVEDGYQPIEYWSNRRFIKNEYPYKNWTPCVSY